MIENNFLHIKERDTFESLKEDIKDDSLTFIKETGSLYHKGKEFLQTTWNLFKDPNAKPEIVTTLTLDQSISGPTKMVTGPLGKDSTPRDNVVTWIRSQSHRYVGTYNANDGMMLKQLDDNDSTKYADGTDASEDIKSKDVFMKMPDFWFKGVQVEENNEDKWNILFSAIEPIDKDWTKWDGNTLIGVYEAVAENKSNNTTGELFSRSDVKPTGSVSQENFKAKARNRSNGDDHFMLVTYEAHQVMALLYMCYYGNMNGQTVIGKGTSDYPKVTGQTNIDGMNDTVAENTRSINFWGLENWWGDLAEWVDNLRVRNISGDVDVLNYDDSYKQYLKSTKISGHATRMILGKTLHMLANVTGGSTTTYYCDLSYSSSNMGHIAQRSSNGSTTDGGPFYLVLVNSSGITYGAVGSRLLYNGRVTILK